MTSPTRAIIKELVQGVLERDTDYRNVKMKLIHADSGKVVQVGDTVTDFRGETSIVTGWDPPRHSASSGRINVDLGGGQEMEYFPSVYGLKFVDA